MKILSCVLVPFLLSGLTSAASSFTPARPPAFPLAVKSPYLSTWLFAGSDGGNGGYLAGEWPKFWNGLANRVTGWTGFIRVDGTPYRWLGAAGTVTTNVQQTAASYTSTRSTFIMDVAGKVQMTIEFMSPVYPNDLKRQSIEFSYMDVAVRSSDGKSHKVQIYTDVSGEWASGNNNKMLNWNYGSTGYDTVYHRFYGIPQEEFSESGGSQQTEDGYWYYATNFNGNLSFTQDSDTTARSAFVSNGKLNNQQNSNFRTIADNYPVFAYAQDFGSVNGNSQHQTFTIGYSVEEAIQFNDGTHGTQSQQSLWMSYFSSALDTVSFAVNDYGTASNTMTTMDNQIATDSMNAAGQDYLTITSLTVRQAFGALVLANTQNDPYLWLKEISSDGNVQTVDVIFPTSPIILYLNPTLLKYILKPLLIYQESGAFKPQYAAHDLGANFPNATSPGGEVQQVEESGNMIIMALAYAQRKSDTAFLNKHYSILMQWNQFLISSSRIPGNQISTDDFQGSLANQTNLAIKGIIGIKAMAQIASMTGHSSDASNFNSIASRYLNDFVNDKNGVYAINYGANPPHATLAYQWPTSHGLLYNLYADRLLGLNFVPQKIYDIQSTFYGSIQGQYKFGVPLDTRNNRTKLDWECWVAAISSGSTKSMFYSKLANWINQTPTNEGLTDLYDVNSGDYTPQHFSTRPVVGGVFAELAMM